MREEGSDCWLSGGNGEFYRPRAVHEGAGGRYRGGGENSKLEANDPHPDCRRSHDKPPPFSSPTTKYSPKAPTKHTQYWKGRNRTGVEKERKEVFPKALKRS